ncbi:helix-turn-helix domain-containing protein [Mucisphaera sp.]|uniref:helix-turn-helix domain-containing protein n=1 Tax=Mucisphaera sp. TaxID=2913024 RepID=UPI003D0F438A
MSNCKEPSRCVPASIPRLLTYRQAGEVLGVTERTVWALVNRRVIPSVRIGYSVRIDPADLESYIQQSKRGCQTQESEGVR